jgi:hypothetical protein
MELVLVFLSTATGTVVGVAAAIFMMQRKSRANMGSDSILRTQLQNMEWALASAGRDVEELRKQLEERQTGRRRPRASHWRARSSGCWRGGRGGEGKREAPRNGRAGRQSGG